MKRVKRLTTLLLALLTFLSLFTGVAQAASSEEEALGEVGIYNGGDLLSYLTINGRVQTFVYTYYNYQSPTGKTKEIPAYCVNPTTAGVPQSVPKGQSIRYKANEKASDPKLTGIVANGYPTRGLGELGLENKEQAYYATKIALWCYIQPGWDINDLKVNPNITDSTEKARAQKILAAAQDIYRRGSGWSSNLAPSITTSVDRSEAYPVTIDGQSYKQQVITLRSSTWVQNLAVKAAFADPSSVPAGTKIVDMDNKEISQVSISKTAPYTGQCKVLYPADSMAGQSGSVQLSFQADVFQYAVFYAVCAERDKYGNLQNYMCDTDPVRGMNISAVSTYGDAVIDIPENPDEPDDPNVPSTPAETGLEIRKVAAGTNDPLEGAVFEVKGPDGDVIGTFSTDADGRILLELTVTGTYIVTEKIPPQYYLPAEQQTQTVTVTYGEVAKVTFANEPYGNLRVEKVDAAGGGGLSGAQIRIRHITTGATKTGTTNEAGVCQFTELTPGAWEIQELTAPKGYQLDSSVHTVNVVHGEITSYTLVNEAKPDLRIIKYDRKNMVVLSGVTFEVYRDGVSLGQFQTDQQGEILLTDLTPGTYRAFEVDTGDLGYVLDTTPQEIELMAGDGIRELLFFNDVKPGLRLVKVDAADPSRVIPNAVFAIQSVAGDYGPEEFTTDENGEIDLSKLPVGAYVVTEKSCPGYVIDEAQRIIQLDGNEDAEFVFTNSIKPSLRIVKRSSDGSPLAGVHFRIAKIEDGSHYLDRITDTNGEILISDLEPGVYSVKETATVSDHILDLREYHVELFPGKTSVLTIENQERPNLIVYKHDADTGAPVPNTVFLVKAADGHSVDEIRTDAGGKAALNNLLPGVYEISEKSVPAPYLMDAEPQLVTLYPNRSHTVYFENHKKPTLTVNKVDSITGSPIKGAKFEVWYGSNSTSTGELNSLGTFFSDADGQFTLDLLRDGWYKVTELEPAAGYTIKEPATQEFYIKGGESKSITFENVPKNAIIVEKYDSVTGEALAGCTFQLRYLGGTSGTGGTVIGQKVTGKNGMAIWTGLEPGTYVLEEVDPADGYSIIQSSETIFLADSGEQSVVTVRFTNAPDGQLLIRKVCSVNPSVTLQNAEFKVIYADGTVVGDSNGIFRTDENGEILITGLKPGKSVVVTETRAPAGFIMDTQSQTVQIKEGRTVSLTFKNQPKEAIIIQKRDSATGQPLSGAEFRVATAAGCEVGLDGVIGTSTLTQNGIFTTDANGEIKITNLAPGAYVLTEVKAPTGYVMDSASTNVVIGQGGDTQIVVVTNSKAGTLVIDKRDSLTGTPLEGVTFRITTSTGEFVPAENGQISSNGLYFTDKDGKITINGVVGTLVVTETATIPGYTIDEATRTQTVVVNPNDTQTLHFTNTPSTTLVIEKYIEGTTTPLKGVTFLVTDSSGAVVGQSNGEYITDENGRITIEGLEPGITVTAREVKTPEGYVLDTTPKSIKIKAGEVQTLRFYNSRQGTLVIRKLDSVTKEPLTGVEFELTYAEGGYVDDANGHLSSKGLYTTDSNGEIRISGITGTIVARETKTIDGYTIDPATRSQTVVVNSADTQTLTFYNDPISGVEIIKVNAADQTERIPNTTFEIRRINDELIDTVTTDENGRVARSLDDGSYYAVEIKAADGFKVDPTPHYFEVQSGKPVTLTITNEAFSGILIHKIDASTREGIYGVTFLLYDSKKNPIGQYTSDDRGYVYIDDLPGAGRYYLRELENEGYIVDEQLKTVYVESGATTEIEWENTAVTGQIQITKTSADYNSVNGWPAGTLIPNTEFEIYNYRTGNLVDTIKTDKNGVASSKPLPLGRYKIVESKAAPYYGLDITPIEVEIEFAGQIIKAAMTNKSLYTNVSIKKTGYTEVMPGQSIRYDISEIANNSTTALTSFYWRDTIPVKAVRLDKIVTGSYNVQGNYKIAYRTNLSGETYRTLADNLSTMQVYVLDASAAALGLASGEYVTEFMVSFGVVPSNFRVAETPRVYCSVVSWLTGGTQFVNQVDAGGVYDSQWIMATSRWVTKVYQPSKPLPRTGY